MAQSRDFFNDVRDIMKLNFIWFDQPDTLFGRTVKYYSMLRLLTVVVLMSVAISQLYYYGMSYVVHDSVVLVPLGMIAVPTSIYTSVNFNGIVRTASKTQTLIDTFSQLERDIIGKELLDNKIKTHIIVKALDYYVNVTAFLHFASISCHYFVGRPQKPVVLPLLYEKFLEGNLELRPILIIVVLLSLVYINILNSFSAYLAVTLYVMKAPVGIMKALIHRLEIITAEAGNSSGRLSKPMDLEDIIRKHSKLIEVVRDMMSWNAFALAYTTTASTVMFCLNAITLKQSLVKDEYSSAVIWGTFLPVTIGIVYVLCSQGQEVELESERLLYTIYGLPWFRESPPARRDVLQMIAQGSRLIKLNYKNLTDINMVKFSEVVQTAYSYFMILSSLE